MQHSPQHQLVKEVHSQQRQLVLVATGGGSQAISMLLSQPGASRTVLEARVPYAAAALGEFLGAAPAEYCSAGTARSMAMAAFQQACRLASEPHVAGVACTASLASDRPKRGPHRAHVAWQTQTATTSYELELEKGARDRKSEEALIADLLLNAVAEATGANARINLPLRESEKVLRRRADATPDCGQLLVGERFRMPWGGALAEPQPSVVFPGAFNPLHEGHRQIAAVAREVLGRPVAYEISIENVDKPLLNFIEIEDRLAQFDSTESVWLTRAPTFEEKSAQFPGCTFVVGVDTIARVGHSRYYADESARKAAFANLGARGCRFLVFGRECDGRFCELDDVVLPPELRELCAGVPATRFRKDISSTQLRRAGRSREPD